jgi:hypothetical protein
MGDLNSDLKGFASRNTARGSSPKWGVLIAGFLKYAGVTGAGTIVILAALFLVQRVIQGGLEEKFRSSLRSLEEEVRVSCAGLRLR